MIEIVPGVILSFVATEVAKGAVGEVGKSLWQGVVAAFEKITGRRPEPSDIDEQVAGVLMANDAHVSALANAYFQDSPALRRASRVPQVLRGARILWIDNHPEGNRLERDTLHGLGCMVVCVESTQTALACLGSEHFDVILSDIARSTLTDGVDALPEIRKVSGQTPVIFYVNEVVGPVPMGAFGITALPTELLHLVIDALERTRTQGA